MAVRLSALRSGRALLSRNIYYVYVIMYERLQFTVQNHIWRYVTSEF
jgi:hypothetical protein